MIFKDKKSGYLSLCEPPPFRNSYTKSLEYLFKQILNWQNIEKKFWRLSQSLKIKPNIYWFPTFKCKNMLQQSK